MDPSQIAVPASAAVSVLGLIGLLIKWSMRLGALEVKVETMWAFQMRRAISETVASGMGTLNSPLKFSDLAIASLEPIKQDLLEFWKTMPPGISDAEALLPPATAPAAGSSLRRCWRSATPDTATGLRLVHLALGGYGGEWRDNVQQIDSRSDGAEGRYPRYGTPLFERRRPALAVGSTDLCRLTGLAPLLIQVGAVERLTPIFRASSGGRS